MTLGTCLSAGGWVTLFNREIYWAEVVGMNFSSDNFDKLLKIVSLPAS